MRLFSILCLLTLCTCSQEQPVASPISLVAVEDCQVVLGRLQNAESQWLTSWYGQPAWAEEAPNILSDLRPSLQCNTPSRFWLSLPSSFAARQLQTAVRWTNASHDGPVRCEVFWKQQQDLKSLGSIDLKQAEGPWQTFTIPLPQEAGQLIFSARLGHPGLAEQAAGFIDWAQPRIVTANDTPDQPHVVFLLIDTLRFDALQQMPFLQDLLRQGFFWQQAYAVSNWTLPTVASLFTGVEPHQHGCGRGPFTAKPTGTIENRAFRALNPKLPTLAQAFLHANYATAMIHQNPFLESWTGLQRGFQLYVRTADRPQANHEAALSWWKNHTKQNKFLLLHYMAPHLPNGSPNPLSALGVEDFFAQDHSAQERIAFFQLPDAQKERVRTAYQQAVAELDQQLQQTLGPLLATPNTHLFLFVDHGEEHWDSGGFEHGFSFDDSVIHVPLGWIPPDCKKPYVLSEKVAAYQLGSFALEQLLLPNPLPPSQLMLPGGAKEITSSFPLYRAALGGRRWSQEKGWQELPFTGSGSPGQPAYLDAATQSRLAELGYAQSQDD